MNLRYPLIACIALAAVVGAYFLGRAGAPAPLAAVRSDTAGVGSDDARAPAPPQTAKPVSVAAKGTSLPVAGAPLKNTFAELQARARAGDAAAAARLFRDLDRCSRLRGSAWKNAAATVDLTSRKTDGMNPAQLRTYQMLMDTMELRQQAVRQAQDLCAGVGDDMLGSLVDNLAQAARLGDKEARACYLGRGPTYDARSLLAHPESLRTYRSNAAAMIDAGLAAGDWRVVDLLRQAYEPGAQGLLAGLVGADPVQHYRYLRLYRLGAEPHRAAGLDRQLATAASQLSPAQLADANQWAQATLRDRFNGNSTAATPPGWEACAF